METVKEMCGDNRFEVIQRAKEHLIEATNIESSPDEMKVLDSFLFRAWQMEWLRKYDPAFQDATDTNVGDKWVSVDERLPEDGSSVFVMLTHTYESDYVTYGIARYIDTSNGERHWCEDHHGYLEWDKYSDGRGGCSSYKVTRWMPIPVIPQPPKEE